jgi:hypothetical protein
MTTDALDHDLDEPTIACRYLLYTVSPDGAMQVKHPASNEVDPPPESETRRWVLVKRGTDPARGL